MEKVDHLINLVGELVITQAMLAQNSQSLDDTSAPEARQQLASNLADLERNTRDLQEAVLSIRMLPMAFVFNRFPRMIRDLAAKLATLPENTKVFFTAHSLPQRIIDAGDPYPQELRSTAEAVAAAARLGDWSNWAIAWQSAGRTPEPWLGPDILQVIDDLAASRGDHQHDGQSGVLVSAVGFVADHLEVLYDLDIEARHHAESKGLAFDRTTCVNSDRNVMHALAERVIEAVR